MKFRIDDAVVHLGAQTMSNVNSSYTALQRTLVTNYTRAVKAQALRLLMNVKLLTWKDWSGRTSGTDTFEPLDLFRVAAKRLGDKLVTGKVDASGAQWQGERVCQRIARERPDPGQGAGRVWAVQVERAAGHRA